MSVKSVLKMIGRGEVRSKIITLWKEGSTQRAIAQRLLEPLTHVQRTIERFKKFNTVEDRPKTGRPRTTRTPAIIQKTKEMFNDDPHRSVRSMAKEFGVSRWSLRRVVKFDLKMFAYKFQ